MPKLTFSNTESISPLTGLPQQETILDFKVSKGPKLTRAPIENVDNFSIPSNLVSLNSPYEDYEKSIGNTIYIGDEGPSQLDDYRAENTAWYKNFGNGLASRGLSIIPKTVEMGAAVGGMAKWLTNLIGIGDDANFEDVFNNKVMQTMSQMDDDLKQQFPVYSSHFYNSDKFLDKIGTQKFWFEDGFDGLAFLASTYLTGGATIGMMTKAGLSRGMAMGMGTLANTVGESAMEAKETHDTIYQQLIDSGVDPKIAKEKAAKYAVNTFGANMLLLGPSNAWETKLLFGSASDGFLKTAQKIFKGEITKPEVESIMMGMAEGIGKEGLWEEGLQTAVQKWEQRRAKGEVDDSGLFGGYIKQWFKNWSDVEGQTSMFLGGLIGMGGGGIGTYNQNKENKKVFEEAGKFVNNWKQQLEIGSNTFNDNYKNIYLKKEDGSFYLKPGDPVQNEDGTLTETQEPIENIDGLTKRALQINNDNHALETAISAVINNDEVAHTIAKNDILSRKLFSYLSNPLFESTNEAFEYFKKDTKEAVDKLSQSEVDETEKSVLTKGYNESLGLASQIKEKWDSINKTFGSSEDLFSDSLQQEFNTKVKKAILVNEIKKLSIEQIKNKQFAKLLKNKLQDNTKFEDALDLLYSEAQESIDNFSNKKSRNRLFNEYKQDNLDREEIEKEIKLLEFKKAKDGVLSQEDQDSLDKLKYDFNLDYYINGESYLNRIGGNTSREILLNDNFMRNTKLDRLGRKNNYYLNKGLDEKSYSDHLEVVDDYISKMDENPLYLLEATKTLNSLLRQVQDPLNSNIDEKRYSELTSKIVQVKDLLKQELKNIDQEILDNEDLLYDIGPDGLEERTDISDDERDEIQKQHDILNNLKKEIESNYDTLVKNPVYTNSKESLLNKNKVFKGFAEAKQNGKLDEFLEQEFIERYYITAPLAYIENFRLNPEDFDDINEINKIISDLNYITKIIKDKYPELYKQLKSIQNIFEKEIKSVVLKNSQQRLLIQKRNEINDKKSTWYQLGIFLDNPDDEFRLELFNNNTDSEILNEIKKIIGSDIIDEILNKASSDNYDLAYFYSILNLIKEKDEKTLKNLKDIIIKSKAFYTESISDLDLHYSHKSTTFKIKDSPSTTFSVYKGNPNLLLKDLLNDGFIKGVEIKNTKSNPSKYSPEDELWYYSPLYKFFQNNSALSLLTNLKQKGYTGTSLDAQDLIKLLQLHLRYSALFNLEELLSSDFDYGTFLSELKKVSNDFDIAPTYEQQLSLRDIISWYSTDKTYAYMKGIAGAGKTNIVTKYAVKMLGLESDQILAFAHNEMASDNIKKAINPSQETVTLEYLYNNYKTLITDKTQLLVLDEVNANESDTLWRTSVTSLQSIILEINKQRALENKKELKLFMLGDPTQITQEKSLYNTSLSAIESSKILSTKINAINPLTLSYRSDVSSINEVSKKFQDNPREVKSIKISTTLPLGTPDIKGVYATTLKRNAKGIIEEFDTQISNPSTRSKLVIVLNEQDKVKYNNLNIPNLNVLTFEEAQGTTFGEVYVDINKDEYLQQYLKNEDNSELEFNTGMYTSLSRASEFVMFLDNSSSFINEVDATSKTINSELKKEKEDNKTLLNETINKSLDILGIKPEEITKESEEEISEDKETEIKDEDIIDTNTVEDTDPIVEPAELISPVEENEVSDNIEDIAPLTETVLDTKTDSKDNFVVEINAPQFESITTNFDPILNQSRLLETSEGLKFVPLVQKGTKVHYILSRNSIKDNSLVIKIVGRRTEVEDKKHVILNAGNYYEVVGVSYLDSLNPENPFENYLLEKASKIENVDVLFTNNKSEELSNIEGNPNILISGEISAVQQQTFVYDNKNIPNDVLEKEGGLKEYILKRAYKLLANKHTLDTETTFYKDAKVSDFKVKIFKKNDSFKKIAPEGFNSEKYAGYPYAIFDISFKDKNGTVRKETRFVRLDPRRLNTEDTIYKTIVRYRNAINNIEDAFINEKVFTKDLQKFGLSNRTFNKILAEFRRDFTSQMDGKDFKGNDKFNVVPKDVPSVTKEDIEKILEESNETNTIKISDALFSVLQNNSKDIIPLTYKAKKVSQKTSLKGYLSYLESQVGETISQEDYESVKQYYDKLYETGIINEDNTNFGVHDKYLIDFAKRTSLTQSELKVLFNMSKTFFIAENQYEEALMGTKNVIKQLASQGVLNSEDSTGVMTEDARTYLNSIYHKIRTFKAAVEAMSFIPKYTKDKDGNLIKDEYKHYGWDSLTGKVKVYPTIPDDRFVSSPSEDLELVKLVSGEGQINKALNNLVQANFTKKITVNPTTGEEIVDNPLRLVKYLPSGKAYVAPTVLSYSDDVNYQYLKYIRETFNNYIDTLDPKNRQFDELKDEHGIKFQTLERYTQSWPGKLRKDLQLENENIRKKIVSFLLDKKVITVEELNEHINSIPKRRITSDDLNEITESIEKSELRFPLNRFKLDDLSKQAALSESTVESEQKKGKESLKELESLLVTNLKDIKPTRVQIKINNKENIVKKEEPIIEEKPVEEPPKGKTKSKKVFERKTIREDGQFSIEQMEDGSFTVYDNGEFAQGINFKTEKAAIKRFEKFVNSRPKIETTSEIQEEIKTNNTEEKSLSFNLDNLDLGNLTFDDITPEDSITLTEWDTGEIQKQLEEEEGKKNKDLCGD